MSLQPVTGLLATVVGLAEHDPDAANEFVRLGLYEALQDQIEVARPALEADAVDLIAKQAAKARVHLLREYVGKALDHQTPDDATAIAEGLAVLDTYVSKDGPLKRFFNGKPKASRDTHGRFASVDTLGVGRGSGNLRHDSAKDDAFQHVTEAGLKPTDTVQLQFSNNRRKTLSVAEVDDYVEQQREADDKQFLTGIKIPEPDHKGNLQGGQGAAYDAMAGFTGGQLAGNAARAIPTAGAQIKGTHAAENWNNLSDMTNGQADRRSYRRMSMTGNALQAVSQPGSAASTVGSLASLIGDIGPEAERVLSPGFTRIAYRYRGTEKRPDADMVNQLAVVNPELAVLDPDLPANAPEPVRMNAIHDSEQLRANVADQFVRRGTVGDPVAGIFGFYSQPNQFRQLTADQRAMRIRGDLMVADLIPSVPNAKLADLSTHAGQTPPSVGVILDGDGKVVSQAMGFNGDHYLPFDLKNLKGLHGGQYIRTRTTGGPTTEDIYTSLLAGARQMQVVSNSGVYTVEFDPDLRGGRRYSDKAAKMVERYGRILDAVGHGSLYRQGLSPKRLGEIYEASMEANGWDEKAGKAEFKERKKEALLRETAGQDSGGNEKVFDQVEAAVDAQIQTEGARGGKQMVGSDRAKYKAELMRTQLARARETAVSRYELNGPGYHDALKALKTEFPYYIRSVKYEEMSEFYDKRKLGDAPKGRAFASDSGYTPPGANRATAERGGYYDEAVAGTKDKKNSGHVGGWKGDNTQEAEASVDPETGETTAQAGRTGVKAPLTAVKFGRVQVMPVKNTKPLSSRTEAATRQLAMTAPQLMNTLSLFYGLGDKEMPPLITQVMPVVAGQKLTDDEVLAGSSSSYAVWKWKSFAGGGQANQFSHWLMHDANDQQRQAVASTITQLPSLLAQAGTQEPLVVANLGGTDAMKEKISVAAALISSANPFAPPGARNMLMAPPTSGKPQPFPEIDKLGDKIENYDDFERKAGGPDGRDRPLAAKIAELSGKPDAEIAGLIERALYDHRELADDGEHQGAREVTARETDIANTQMAWSFIRGKSLAKALTKAPAPTVGGSPKAQAPSGPLQATRRESPAPGLFGVPQDPAAPPAAPPLPRKPPHPDQEPWNEGKADTSPLLSIQDLAATYSRAEILAYLIT